MTRRTKKDDQFEHRQEQGLAAPESQKTPVERRTDGEPTRSSMSFVPRVDIFETNEGLVLLADVPGARPDGFEITVDRRELTISARVEDDAPEGMHAIHEEYATADFERSFRLSSDLDTEAIEAELAEGVLRLKIPKAAEAKPKKIKLKAGS